MHSRIEVARRRRRCLANFVYGFLFFFFFFVIIACLDYPLPLPLFLLVTVTDVVAVCDDCVLINFGFRQCTFRLC